MLSRNDSTFQYTTDFSFSSKLLAHTLPDLLLLVNNASPPFFATSQPFLYIYQFSVPYHNPSRTTLMPTQTLESPGYE